jgi:hypothetical protein
MTECLQAGGAPNLHDAILRAFTHDQTPSTLRATPIQDPAGHSGRPSPDSHLLRQLSPPHRAPGPTATFHHHRASPLLVFGKPGSDLCLRLGYSVFRTREIQPSCHQVIGRFSAECPAHRGGERFSVVPSKRSQSPDGDASRPALRRRDTTVTGHFWSWRLRGLLSFSSWVPLSGAAALIRFLLRRPDFRDAGTDGGVSSST